jgi:putative endonuclease
MYYYSLVVIAIPLSGSGNLYNFFVSQKLYFVYILSNFTRSVLYAGVTNDLIRRVWEHKGNLIKGFTQKYNIHYLIYYEIYYDPLTAIEREKQIKGWSRKRKEELIKVANPD